MFVWGKWHGIDSESGTIRDQTTPVEVNLGKISEEGDRRKERRRKAAKIACGRFHSVILCEEGMAWVFGIAPADRVESDGILMSQQEGREQRVIPHSRPLRVGGRGATTAVSPVSSPSSSSSISSSPSGSRPLFGGKSVRVLRGGLGVSCAVTEDGKVWEWEWNDEPRERDDLSPWTVNDVSLGFRHSLYSVE